MRIIFDLDGTLVDSVGGMAAAGNRLLAELGRAPVDHATYAGYVGGGTRRQVELLLAHGGGPAPDGLDAAVARFMSFYLADPLHQTHAFDGAATALAALAGDGHRLGVCTQKPEAPARQILRGLGLMPPVEALCGGDTLGLLKPDPRLLHHVAAALGEGPILYVGDSATDAETARRAGCPFVLTGWGYRPEAPVPHDHTIGTFAELPSLVARFSRAAVPRA